jgi:hypothetical protein
MGRKKVKSQTIKSDTPKIRENIVEKKSPISTLPNNYKLKWDKVKGVNGKIVRFKEGDGEEKLKFLNKKNYRQLYVGVDGNDLYFYYEIIE